MSRPRRGYHLATDPWPRLAGALVAAAPWLVACDGNGEVSAPTDTDSLTRAAHEPGAATCPWEPDELLAEVDVSTSGIRDCNQDPGENTPRDCFTGATASGEAALVTTNSCIDCLILSTFVTLPDEGKFLIYREADRYGDSLRVVRVDSCTDIVPVLTNELGCTGPSTLYDCSDPLPDPTTL